jgi:hypothetical protein
MAMDEIWPLELLLPALRTDRTGTRRGLLHYLQRMLDECGSQRSLLVTRLCSCHPFFAERRENSALRAALLTTGGAEPASAWSTGSVKGESTRHSWRTRSTCRS